MQNESPAARTERRGNPGEMQPTTRLNQRLPGRILETELRSRGVLAIVNDTTGARQRSGFVEHQPQTGIFDPPYPARIDPVPPSLAIDNAAERPDRQP